MDTTQDHDGKRDDPAHGLDELREADPAEAPEVAERLADELTAALDGGDSAPDAPGTGDPEGGP